MFASAHTLSMPAHAPSAPPPPHVCTTFNPGTTWKPFRFPAGLAYVKDLPCEPPSELEQSDVWLPVTHVGGPSRGPTDSGGLWFYYARGCSDLQWNVGRSLLVRNRAHAAVRIEQLRAAQASPMRMPLSELEAAQLVAAWIRARHPKWAPLRAVRHFLGANATIEQAIGEAARGLYGHCPLPTFSPGGFLNPCLCAGNSTRVAGSSRRRQLALTPICGDKVLSLHSEPLLGRLPLDSLILHQQPQGGGNPSWTTEIWDVRGAPALSRHLENASAHPEVVARSRWAPEATVAALDTEQRKPLAECVPSETWYTCFACKGSALEPHCNGTVGHYRAHGLCYHQKMKKKSMAPGAHMLC